MMKSIKILPFFLIACMSITACSQEKVPMDQMTHIGCQENEIDKNGECLPAEENNASLFGQDFSASVETSEINENEVKGFLAQPIQEGEYPGVIMIHEWWGLNENVKEMAQILANEGYKVFAIDLYGEVADTSDKARELATSVRENPDEAIQKMKKAVAYLQEQNTTKIASMGWCFGGQQSLNLSLNEDLDATVIYYGHLIDDKEELKNISEPVLGIFGSEDSSISVESVRAFESALDDLAVENDITIYEGVGHAFANPSGSSYAAKETIDAWEKTLKFLESHLKEE